MRPLGFPFRVVFRNNLFLAFVLMYTFKSLFSLYFYCFQIVVLVSPFVEDGTKVEREEVTEDLSVGVQQSWVHAPKAMIFLL